MKNGKVYELIFLSTPLKINHKKTVRKPNFDMSGIFAIEQYLLFSTNNALLLFLQCPHDMKCPKMSRNEKCFFEKAFIQNPFDNKERRAKETYSYVVLKKGKTLKNF